MGQLNKKKDINTKKDIMSKNGTNNEDYYLIKKLLKNYFEFTGEDTLLISDSTNCYLLQCVQFGLTRLSMLVKAFERSKFTFIIIYDSSLHMYNANIYVK